MWNLMENIIETDDLDHIGEFLKSTDRFTNGRKVAEFENSWARWVGVEKSVMVNSGASGNYLTVAIVKELFGTGEIIVPSLGWSSDVSSIVQLGMTPVFVDVDLPTMGISATSLKQALNANTKAVVIVHALGFNAITEEVKQILADADVFVIEDCCEAHGAKLYPTSSNKVGSFGNLSVFSFYFGHHITTIEGGMVCTNDEELHQLARMLRSHGMTREASEDVRTKYQNSYPDLNPLFTFALAGFNFRSTELNAVLGLSQLNKIDNNIEVRQRNLLRWLDNLKGSVFFTNFNLAGNSSFALPLVLSRPDVDLWTSICKTLDTLGVEYRLGTAGGGNLSKQPFVKKYPHVVVDDQSTVNHLHSYALCVGNGTHVTGEKIDMVTDALLSL